MREIQHYEIRVAKRFESNWLHWFEGLTVRHDENGETVISGWLPDQAALYGVLAKVHSLNLGLLSVLGTEPRRVLPGNDKPNEIIGRKEMTYETVICEVTDGIATITMNRPDKRNAQNMKMLGEMDQAFETVGSDPNVRVVILAGAGPHFSAGHDLREVAEIMSDGISLNEKRKNIEGRTDLEQKMYFDTCMRIRNLSKPTIAQVQGQCIAGAWMTAAMCDIIVASEDARFINPVIALAAVGVEVLIEPWEVGARKAKELMFTGEAIDAAEGFRLGLVNRVVSREKLEDEVTSLARKIAAQPPVAISWVKASINRTLDRMGQADSWAYHFALHQMAHSTNEYSEIAEKRSGTLLTDLTTKSK